MLLDTVQRQINSKSGTTKLHQEKWSPKINAGSTATITVDAYQAGTSELSKNDLNNSKDLIRHRHATQRS